MARTHSLRLGICKRLQTFVFLWERKPRRAPYVCQGPWGTTCTPKEWTLASWWAHVNNEGVNYESMRGWIVASWEQWDDDWDDDWGANDDAAEEREAERRKVIEKGFWLAGSHTPSIYTNQRRFENLGKILLSQIGIHFQRYDIVFIQRLVNRTCNHFLISLEESCRGKDEELPRPLPLFCNCSSCESFRWVSWMGGVISS